MKKYSLMCWSQPFKLDWNIEVVFKKSCYPFERGWCKDQAQNLRKSRIAGRYQDAFTENLWILTIRWAVSDHLSHMFIECTMLDVSISRFEEILDGVKIGEMSEIALAWWDDGTVVSVSWWDKMTAQDFGSKLGHWWQDLWWIRSLVDFEHGWTL